MLYVRCFGGRISVKHVLTHTEQITSVNSQRKEQMTSVCYILVLVDYLVVHSRKIFKNFSERSKSF